GRSVGRAARPETQLLAEARKLFLLGGRQRSEGLHHHRHVSREEPLDQLSSVGRQVNGERTAVLGGALATDEAALLELVEDEGDVRPAREDLRPQVAGREGAEMEERLEDAELVLRQAGLTKRGGQPFGQGRIRTPQLHEGVQSAPLVWLAAIMRSHPQPVYPPQGSREYNSVLNCSGNQAIRKPDLR